MSTSVRFDFQTPAQIIWWKRLDFNIFFIDDGQIKNTQIFIKKW